MATLIYNLTETWLAETLDNKFSKFYRRCLQMPVSGSTSISHLSLTRSKVGLEIKTYNPSIQPSLEYLLIKWMANYRYGPYQF